MKRSFEKLPKRKALDDADDVKTAKPNKSKKITEDREVVDSKSLTKIISLLNPEGETLKTKKRQIISQDAKLTSSTVKAKLSDEDDSGSEVDEEEIDNFALTVDFPQSNETLDEDDDRALQSLLPGQGNDEEEKADLAELLKERISTHRTELESEMTDPGFDAMDDLSDLPPELQKHITLLSTLLRQFRSGRVPKTLKMLPQLSNWEGLLEMLQPADWTAAAMSQMTKYFAAKGRMQALHFYSTYLMPRIRDDIAFYKRLNFHLLQALKFAMFRPRELFVGIIIPMCRDELTLPEATVLSGFLRNVSIPVKYTAVGFAQIYMLPFSIPRAVVLQAIIDKKYKLPKLCISNFVHYFAKMDRHEDLPLTDEGRLPVIWFQLLLTFLQLYKESLLPDERAVILKVSRRHVHPKITQEIRRLLVVAQSAATPMTVE